MAILSSPVGVRTVGPASMSDGLAPARSRLVLVFLTIAALLAGFAFAGEADSSAAVVQAGADLTRLLRFMALIKAGAAGLGIAAVVWRLGVPVATGWLAAYAVACGSMAAGPGLIWSMSHVVAGAVLLHGGLLATVLLLWRDPAVGRRLAGVVAARRARLRR